MSVSERLTQEDKILREIRMTLSTFRSVSPEGETHRHGAVYASSPITSGLRFLNLMRETDIKSPQELKSHPSFKNKVMEPNLIDGESFGKKLRANSYPLVIVPGAFFAKNWAQEHYMSLWRQVIIRFASKIAFNANWEWSSGCVEEFLISVENEKKVLDYNGKRVNNISDHADMIRKAIDQIDQWGLEPKPLYDLWRQVDLTLDNIRKKRRISIS